jgi:excisionase family DNA binding protein
MSDGSQPFDSLVVPDDWRGKAVLKVSEVAPHLRLSRDDLYRLAAAGQIPSFKLGGRRLFKTHELIAWLESA